MLQRTASSRHVGRIVVSCLLCLGFWQFGQGAYIPAKAWVAQEMMQRAGYNPIEQYGGPDDLSRLEITNRRILKQGEATTFVMKGTDLSRCFGDMTQYAPP